MILPVEGTTYSVCKPPKWRIYPFLSVSSKQVTVRTIQEILHKDDEDVKYKALEVLSGHIIYGGRILDAWDQRCLNTLFKGFFCRELSTDGFSYLNSKVFSLLIYYFGNKI